MNLITVETPFIDDFELECDPGDLVVKFGLALGRPSIIFKKPSGFHYMIINQRVSGYQAAWWEPDISVELDVYTNDKFLKGIFEGNVVFQEIGPKTLKRIQSLWEKYDNSKKLEDIKKLD